MWRAAWLLLIAPLARPSDGPLERGLVRSVELQSPRGTWVQHFRIDREGAREDALPLGLARYVAGPDDGRGIRVELELQYLEDDLLVVHTERASQARRGLVFREVHGRGGRTLFLEGTSEDGFRGHELGGPAIVRRELDCGGELPLLLMESERLGWTPCDEARVLDPLSAELESLRLTSVPEGDERRFEARRPDGSLRWRLRLRASAILEWRFQDRGPIARAISPEEFEVLRERHDSSVHAAREAAAVETRARRPLGPPFRPTAYR